MLHDSIETLNDLLTAATPFLAHPPLDDEARELVASSTATSVLATLEKALSAGDELTPESFKTTMKTVGQETSAKGKDLYWPVRAALTGSAHGPDLAAVATIKGKAKVVEQLRDALKLRS